MLRVIGVVMLIFGLLGLAISLFLMFIWKIVDLMDELSGRKAKRQIQRLKELNIGLGTASTLNSSDLYEVMKSGNLVWDTITSGTNGRENFDTGNSEIKRLENTGSIGMEEDNTNSDVLLVRVVEEQTSLRV